MRDPIEVVTDALMARFSQNVPGARERTRVLAEIAIKALLTEREAMLILAALQEKANRYRTGERAMMSPDERAAVIAELNDVTDYVRAFR